MNEHKSCLEVNGGERFGVRHLTKIQVSRNDVVGVVVFGLEKMLAKRKLIRKCEIKNIGH